MGKLAVPPASAGWFWPRRPFAASSAATLVNGTGPHVETSLFRPSSPLSFQTCTMTSAHPRLAVAAAALLGMAAAVCGAVAALELVVPIGFNPSNYPHDYPNYDERQTCTKRDFPGKYYLAEARCAGQDTAIMNGEQASAACSAVGGPWARGMQGLPPTHTPPTHERAEVPHQ